MEHESCTCGQDLKEPEPAPTRRTLLGWMVTVINLGVATALAVPAIRFIVAPLGRKAKESWVDVLPDSDLAPGQTREVTYSLRVQDGYQTVDRMYTVYLYRDATSAVKCFDPACTHLGCRIKFQDDQRRYFCPCHGGVFDENGSVVSGPPPTGLVEHPVRVANGRILVSRKA